MYVVAEMPTRNYIEPDQRSFRSMDDKIDITKYK